MLLGRDGLLVGGDHTLEVTGLPKAKFAKLPTVRPKRLPESHAIHRDGMDACRGARPLVLADFEDGGRLSEPVMLGNVVTLYPGQALEYDPTLAQIANHIEINRGLGFPYREGWKP